MNLLVSIAVVAATAVVAPPSVTDGSGPLDAARSATEDLSFQGSVEVQWREGSEVRREQLTVEDTSGSLFVRGGASVLAIPGQERLVQHGAQWDLLWPAGLESRPRPSSEAKYQTTPAGQSTVAGRLTDVLEVRQQEVVRERVYLDAENGLLLRRDQFDGTGNTDRKVEFKALTIGAPARAAEAPSKAVDETPRRVSTAGSLRNASAPSELADGYHRLGAYRQTGVLHLVYSDGLYDLSLFEQPGTLARGDLPGGGSAVKIRSAGGRLYAWPGGHAVIWQAGANVLTMVSDAPVDQLLRAAGSVKGRSPSPSVLTRLRQAARALVAPFSD
ncbi:MAG TPA: sigma-E factor regulatory protein RseB domain-containing protein [Acidimicrobiales bacterium]